MPGVGQAARPALSQPPSVSERWDEGGERGGPGLREFEQRARFSRRTTVSPPARGSAQSAPAIGMADCNSTGYVCARHHNRTHLPAIPVSREVSSRAAGGRTVSTSTNRLQEGVGVDSFVFFVCWKGAATEGQKGRSPRAGKQELNWWRRKPPRPPRAQAASVRRQESHRRGRTTGADTTGCELLA